MKVHVFLKFFISTSCSLQSAFQGHIRVREELPVWGLDEENDEKGSRLTLRESLWFPQSPPPKWVQSATLYRPRSGQRTIRCRSDEQMGKVRNEQERQHSVRRTNRQSAGRREYFDHLSTPWLHCNRLAFLNAHQGALNSLFAANSSKMEEDKLSGKYVDPSERSANLLHGLRDTSAERSSLVSCANSSRKRQMLTLML